VAVKDIDLSVFEDSNRPGPRCTITVALESLDATQREQVLAAFDAPHIKAVMIQKILSEWSGVKLGYSSVQRHRRKQCNCG
jgi:hypothetical protein